MSRLLTAADIPFAGGATSPEDDERYARRLAWAVEIERARREAARLLDAEARGPVVQPEIETLRERLSRPRPVTRWRIEGLQPADTRMMFAAQFKSGKTTIVGGLLRALVDGDSFLDRFPVTRIGGTVALVDTEMPGGQLDVWLSDQGIRHDDRVLVLPLRGHVSSLDLLDAEARGDWARRLRDHGVRYLILDCLRPVLDVLGLDEHRETGRLLVAFDALLREAEIPEALVVHHMGHLAERARGDSRLRDWPDVEWRLVRQDDDPASPRYFSAYGRDVEIPESRLDYDPSSRRLSMAGGSRRDAKTAEALAAVLDVLAGTTEALSGRALKEALQDTEHGRNTIDAALTYGVKHRRLTAAQGPKRAKLYRPVSQCPAVSRECTGDSVSVCPTPYMEWDTHTHPPAGASVPPFKFDASKAFAPMDEEKGKNP